MTDDRELRALPTARDKTQGDVEAMKRLLPLMLGLSPEIANLRWKMYNDYLAAGFTKEQALELCKSISL